MYAHLRKLQEIADANNGTRAEGTPGYDASVDYVAQTLRDKGFDVQTPEFERLGVDAAGQPDTHRGRPRLPRRPGFAADHHPGGGLSAVTLRPAEAAGCAAADYGDEDDEGRHRRRRRHRMLGRRQAERRRRRGRRRAARGQRPRHRRAPAGLFTPGYYQQLKVPVGVIDNDADAALRRTDAPVLLTLDAKAAMVKSRNVVAQTKTGDTHNVVMAGAHLDTVARSPGINDNGTGVAARAGNRRGAWARSRRSPTPSGSGSGVPRRRCWRGRRSMSRAWTVTSSTTSRCT